MTTEKDTNIKITKAGYRLTIILLSIGWAITLITAIVLYVNMHDDSIKYNYLLDHSCSLYTGTNRQKCETGVDMMRDMDAKDLKKAMELYF